MKRLFCAVLCVAPMLCFGQSKPDLLIFDEDDAVGTGYYDASWGFRNAPSLLQLAGGGSDKLPITSQRSFTGSEAGIIQWTSSSGGNWGIFIASPLWQGRDASGYDSVVFYVNGPAAIAANALPKVNLESTTNAKATAVTLDAHLPGGLDADSLTWQRVSIPLTEFEPYGSFSLSAFKDINFNQNTADNLQHILWIDNIRIVSKDAEVDTTLPPAPQRIVARSGDLSVALHWNRIQKSNLLGYNVYRASSISGPYSKVNTSLNLSPGFADFDVVNGQPRWYYVRAVSSLGEGPGSDTISAASAAFVNDDAFLDYLQGVTFDYFWYEANPENGMVRDRSQAGSPASIAAIGFGLTAYGVGAERGWVTRTEAAQRTLTTLRTLWMLPQSTAAADVSGYKGWFYHFLDMNTGYRTWNCELSSIDTGLLMAGVLYAREFFDGSDSLETSVRAYADSLFGRIDWNWMLNGGSSLSMGWFPESGHSGQSANGFLNARWIGYNEAMILYILGIGANVNPIPASSWLSWTSGYNWFYSSWLNDYHVTFPPLFGHQYSHCWVDFRAIADDYMKAKDITYFENSRRATINQRNYCIDNVNSFAGYSATVWGLTACDGPAPNGYLARGTNYNDDGTIAPTAPGGSIPFAPEYCIPTLRHMYDTYRAQIWTHYGFRDAFNLTQNWWGPDQIGIDQGPILIMAENYLTSSVWNTFMKSAVVQQGLTRAGFTPVSSVADDQTAPLTFELEQNYPNPFNPSTVISYQLSSSGPVTLKLFDLLGREVCTVVDEVQSAGKHTITFDASRTGIQLTSGAYFYQLKAGNIARIRNMMLVR